MAIVSDGQRIVCDGKDCSSEVSLPVALRPILSGDSAVDRLKGWLFVTVSGHRRHYCPQCVPHYLDELSLVDDR